MDIQTLKMVLAATPNTHTVMLKGPHGIGKTEVIRWLAKNVWHQECIEFQASQISDVGDLIGLPRINSETGETEFVPPYWYKKDEHGNPLPVTLFLDEINRGTTLVTNAMMQLGLDHKILNFKLAPGSHVICAIIHLTMQVDAAEAHFVGNGVDAEVGIADILVDDLHDAL